MPSRPPLVSVYQKFKKWTKERTIEVQRISVLGTTMRMETITEWILVRAFAHLYINNHFASIKIAVIIALHAFPRRMVVM